MRKPFLSLAVAGAVALATVSASQAQVSPPIFLRPAAPPAVAPAPAERAPVAELPQVATMRKLLAGRGFGADVTAGPMIALPPGQATPLDFERDGEIDAMLPSGLQAEAWLIETNAGRWWLWDYGATAPADQRAETYQTHAQRHGSAEGRVD
jgi:hypothetical protein